MIFRALFIAISVFFVSGFPADGFADRGHAGQFDVPDKIRPRVDFWKDVLAKYGKNEVVIHHRDYPQVIFGTLDFRKDAESMSDSELEHYRANEVKRAVATVEQALERLSRGADPEGELENRIVDEMKFIAGGAAKYNQSLTDDGIVRSATGLREKTEQALRIAGRYLDIMQDVFTKSGIPKELTLVPLFESSFDYKAYSRVGATGVWQFMPKTAKGYMTVNSLVDERRDPIESTRAAARYLNLLYDRLGTWPLALVGYNSGPGSAAAKVRKLGTTNIATIIEHPSIRVFGFAGTNYYAEFLASLEIYNERKKWFPNLEMDPPVRIVEIPLSRAVSVEHVVTQLSVDRDDLHDLNYGLADTIWSGRYKIPAGYTLKIPKSAADNIGKLDVPEIRSNAVELKTPPPIGNAMRYVVKKGDILAGIAKHFGVSVPQLKKLNGLKRDYVTPGQSLTIRAAEKTNKPKKKPAPSSGKVKKKKSKK